MVDIIPKTPQGKKGWQFSVMSPELAEGLEVLAGAGYQSAVKCGLDPDTGAVAWSIDLFKQNYPVLKIAVDDWIVWDGVIAAVYPTTDFSDKFEVATKLPPEK